MTVLLATTTVADPAMVAEVTASATMLPTGEALLLLDGTGLRLPDSGRMQASGEMLGWQAEVWDRPEDGGRRWQALAVVEALPRGDGLLYDEAGFGTWAVTVGARVGGSALDLVAWVRATQADVTAVFRFLSGLRDRDPGRGEPQDRALRAFLQDFLEAVAIRDGFIELMAEPQTGGLFLQGWAQTISSAPLRWISPTVKLAEPELTVSAFDRPDLLSPARGLCLFHKDLRFQDVLACAAGYVEQDGRLLRLDLVSSTGAALSGAGAGEHVAQMIPRLHGQASVLASFHRICRPLYSGEDTLTSTALPIAIGLDVVMQAPDGALLVLGWCLDPDALADMVLIKGRTGRYARISDDWVRLPRPDLTRAFAADPRFAGRLAPDEAMSGFIVRVPPGPEPQGGREDLYIEIVLADHKCLFRPMPGPTPFGAEHLPRILAGLSPTEPELARIIDDQLLPVLSSLRPMPVVARRGGTRRAIPLGRARDPAPVTALMPFATLDELQAVFGLLAGTPEAAGLDLTLIAPRCVVEEVLRPLQQAFRFYGLVGRLVIAPTQGVRTDWLETALQTTDSTQILVWSPQALPKAPGWLSAMQAEMADLDRPGVISPVLTYEDGSIRFGPTSPGQASPLGYGRGWLARSGATEVPAASAEIALIQRARLTAAGGFVGHQFSDAYAHVDLSMRLAGSGAGIWCSGEAEFWCLDQPPEQAATPQARILRQVDARLLALRWAIDPEEFMS